jgi:hypothetical protein
MREEDIRIRRLVDEGCIVLAASKVFGLSKKVVLNVLFWLVLKC